jgi:hypothetical protein
MGRPIKKKFFGNVYSGGVGGEGVTTVTVGTGTSAPVSTLTVTVSFSAPSISGGVTAAGTPVKTGNTVTSVTITEAGSGYTSAPTVTFTGTSMTQVGTGTAVLTSRLDAISFSSYISTGTVTRSGGDIIKQESSRRYLVRNSDGVGQCTLVAANTTSLTLVAGQMSIIATDANSSTYYVAKLTARRARLRQKTVNGSFLIADNAVTGWTIGSSTGTIVSIAHTV